MKFINTSLFLFLSLFILSQTHSVLSIDEVFDNDDKLVSSNNLYSLGLSEGSLTLTRAYMNCSKWSLGIPEGGSIILETMGLSVVNDGSVDLLIPANGAFEMSLQEDGNLIIFNKEREVLWSSGTTDVVDFKRKSSDRLFVGNALYPGNYLISNNKRYKFSYELDGNLVLYGISDATSCNSQVLWESSTKGLRSDKLILTDTSLELIGKDGVVFSQAWEGAFASELVMGDEGDLVVESLDDIALWHTDTSLSVSEVKPLTFIDELDDKCVKFSYYDDSNNKREFEFFGKASDYHVYIKKISSRKIGYLFNNKSGGMLSSSENGEKLELHPKSGSSSIWYIEDIDQDNASFSGKAHFKNNLSGGYIMETDGFGFTSQKDKALVFDISIKKPEDCWYKPVDLAVSENNQIGNIDANNRSASSSFSGLVAPGVLEYDNEGREVLYGAIDSHSHATSTSALGGVAIHGKNFSEDGGIAEALPDCFGVHGPIGIFDLMSLITFDLTTPLAGNLTSTKYFNFMSEEFWTNMPQNIVERFTDTEKLLSGRALHMHETSGYPEFESWPAWDRGTHSFFYYEWLNRARMGGLKMITIFAQESRGGCKALELAYSILKPIDPFQLLIKRPDCDRSEMDVINQQLDEIDDLERFVREKDGGWLKVVTTSEEARDAVREGKMAIVKGVESSAMFDCINWVGNERDGRKPCDKGYIEEQVNVLRNQKRVSVVYPVHHYDNDFAGSSMADTGMGIGVQLLSFMATGRTLEAERCERIGQGPSVIALRKNDALSGLIKVVVGSLVTADWGIFDPDLYHFAEFPDTPPVDIASEPGWCNKRGITKAGETLLMSLAKNNILIDSDHMSIKAKKDAYMLMSKYDIPINSFHFNDMPKFKDEMSNRLYDGRIRGVNSILMFDDNKKKNFKYPGCTSATSKEFAQIIIRNGKFHMDESTYKLNAHIFGTDTGGGPTLAAPRFSDDWVRPNYDCDFPENTKLQYPFTSFDGRYVFDRMTSGYRIFDYNTQGMSTFGQFPDLVADMQALGYTDDQLKPLFRGAELFIRNWEDSEVGFEKARKGISSSRIVDGELAVEIYPTLVKDYFTLENNSNMGIELSMYNEKGSLVGSWSFESTKEIKLDNLSYLNSGTYFIHIIDKEGNQSKNISIMKK